MFSTFHCSSGSTLFSESSTMTLIHSIDPYILIDNSSLRCLHKRESWLNILTSHIGHCNCPQESNRKNGGIRMASLAGFLINTSITAFYSEGPLWGWVYIDLNYCWLYFQIGYVQGSYAFNALWTTYHWNSALQFLISKEIWNNDRNPSKWLRRRLYSLAFQQRPATLL